jgi:hypothetical protein
LLRFFLALKQEAIWQAPVQRGWLAPYPKRQILNAATQTYSQPDSLV